MCSSDLALIGAAIGQKKSKALEGFVAGLLLGPIGLIWIIVAKAKYRCPECQGAIEKGVAKCRHCGSEILDGPKQEKKKRGNVKMKKIFKISLITIGAFILLIIIIGVFAPEENESEQKAIKTEFEAPIQKAVKPKPQSPKSQRKPSSMMTQDFDEFSLSQIGEIVEGAISIALKGETTVVCDVRRDRGGAINFYITPKTAASSTEEATFKFIGACVGAIGEITSESSWRSRNLYICHPITKKPINYIPTPICRQAIRLLNQGKSTEMSLLILQNLNALE